MSSAGDVWVASFTDAWIETAKKTDMMKKKERSHLLQMRGLKHPSGGYQVVRAMSHLLQMRGLKRLNREHHRHKASRIFYRCVD